MDDDVAARVSEGQRAMWASGDWPAFASRIQGVAETVVERVGVRRGEDFLDVATGSGNVALAAAGVGATVTGLDLVPELVEAARRRFATASLAGEFVVGNAEDLPFGDATFDRAASAFGAIFAPRHERAAAELIRVVRPGGVIGVTGWTPEGLNGRMFGVLGKFAPPPPPGFVAPVRWGEEDHVRELFTQPGITVECERLMARIEFERADGWIEYCEENLGPIVTAKASLEPEGRWEEARAALSELEAEANLADDGSFLAEAEYLLTIVTKPI